MANPPAPPPPLAPPPLLAPPPPLAAGAVPVLTGPRTVLEPLSVEHADEMASVLDNPLLHTFTGGAPLGPEDLRRRYVAQTAGRSPDGSQIWLNWVVRLRDAGSAAGYVQATVHRWRSSDMTADVAWVIGTAHQGQGFAREAAGLMVGWLRDHDVAVITAHIHPGHGASQAVARSLGLLPTDEVVDGEIRWSDERPIAGPERPGDQQETGGRT